MLGRFLVTLLLAAGVLAPPAAQAQPAQSGLSPCPLNNSAITLAVANTTSNVQLSTCGPVVVIWNVGSVEAFINVGSASNTAATTAGWSVPGSSFRTFNFGTSGLYLAAITSSSSTTLRVTQGIGYPGDGVGGGGAGGVTSNVNLNQVGGSTITIGQAAMAASLPVVVASDQLPVPISGTITLPSGASTSANQTTEIGTLSSILTGINNLSTNAVQGPGASPGTAATNSVLTGCVYAVSLPTFTDGQQGAYHCNINGVQLAALVSGTAVSLTPATSGGWFFLSTLTPNNTTAVVVKGSAGQLGKLEVFNNSANFAYLKFYNATSATCGAGTPVARYMIPGNSTNGAGFITTDAIGDAYSTGITYCLTTGYADNDTTAPAAGNFIVNVHYK